MQISPLLFSSRAYFLHDLQCTTEIPHCQWHTQGQQFQTSFEVIDLGSYDVILGLDWLKQHSPMNHVDWEKKKMCVNVHGKDVTLRGSIQLL
jgi:hypothetical protein